jgi:hypothetical protein
MHQAPITSQLLFIAKLRQNLFIRLLGGARVAGSAISSLPIFTQLFSENPKIMFSATSAGEKTNDVYKAASHGMADSLS